MSSETIRIDPEKFAYHFMDSVAKTDISKADMKAASKDQLFAYLSAYVLIEQFNQSEASNFLNHSEEDISKLSMGKFLELISQKNTFGPAQK
ncbi:hypothetical protein LOOC260_120800 [Paucilactobacillus hokkaidonensis JCM 18461]|uniref:Uncharacterized protein n=2 Tax=Paucilactobacillus hokkaidonensis TaxID=1193095 RepID=A0A0A1H1I5_9LACO|nr:hypothetical protein [Paucilactobacillus hokkaidonensis]BAP86586.1 hypothetical protein LOOC260_120800 [Paucilactobacillus hokkaidonensis JCM 18461]